jgi:hypothetical protein
MWMGAARPRLASWESGYERGADGGGESTGPSLVDLQWDGPGILDIADIEGAQSGTARRPCCSATSGVCHTSTPLVPALQQVPSADRLYAAITH